MPDAKAIWSSTSLPTLPSVAVRLLELTRSAESDLREVAHVIQSDPAISAKILKAANSSFFGVRHEVKSLEKAVSLLGTTVCTSLALSFSITSQAVTRGPLVEFYQSYWLQSVVQGVAARVVGQRHNPAQASEFFLAGTLLDIGRLAMLKCIPKDYLAVLNRAKTAREPLRDLEKLAFGFDHTTIGYELLTRWELPAELCNAAGHHHDDSSATNETENSQANSSKSASILTVSKVASAVGDYVCGTSKGHSWQCLKTIAEQSLGLDETGIQNLLGEIDAELATVAELFNINTDDLDDPADLMAQANEQLSAITMKAHVAQTEVTREKDRVDQERQELLVRNQELQKRALYDSLTETYNRQFLDQALRREIDRCLRTCETIGVVFLDIDHFKKINDTYGHQFGDEVLKKVATALKSCIRLSDSLARYGGEEFVVLAARPTEEGMTGLANRLRQSVENLHIEFNGQRVPVTISAGATIGVPMRGESDLAAKLLANGDECLYQSKREGRNRVTFRSLLSNSERRQIQLIEECRFSRFLISAGLIDSQKASQALSKAVTHRIRIGELAQTLGLLSSAEVNQVALEQKQSNLRFGEIAVNRGFLTEERLVYLLAVQSENPHVLGEVLLRQGAISPDQLAGTLEEYSHRVNPARLSRRQLVESL